MKETVTITIHDKTFEVERQTTLEEVSKLVKDDFRYEIILAKIDGEWQELSGKVNTDCAVEFFDLTDDNANQIYINALIFLMAHSYKKLTNKTLKVNHSLDKGLFITTEEEITPAKLESLQEIMKDLIYQDLPIQKISIARRNAIAYFEEKKEYEKVKSMRYNTDTYITLYKLENSYDYFYSKMPIRTGVLRHFALTYLDPKGFVLRFPTAYYHEKIKPYEHRHNIYNLFKTSRSWAKTIGLEYVSDLNEQVSKSKINDIIRMEEIKKNAELLDLAKKIADKKEVKFVLLAGPSSSGKTTTCNKLALCLKNCGVKPRVISMDDFFVERKETPLDVDGKPNYEGLEALDLDLFNDAMKKLLNHEEVFLPTYNFLTGSKEFKDKTVLEENEILLIEGLHVLNPEILKDIPQNKKVKVYLSALTELNIDKHVRIATTDNRLLRRIVRDNRTRGYNVSQTLEHWHKVREGEEKYIFPYQDVADYTLNTAMIYEIGVLKIYVEPLLYSVDIHSPYYEDARRLINFLRVFLPISSEEIPIDSVLREFIGGSCFKV